MDPLLLILILVAGAAALILADLFLPSAGILSVLGAGLLLTAVIVCFTINRWLGLAVLFGLTIASPFIAAGMIAAWQRTPVGKRLTLQHETPRPVRPVGPAVAVGSVGRTLTALRPMGEAEFAEGVQVQVIAEHGDLPRDADVKVVHFKDGLATVRGVGREGG